jgi:glycosyltransferase involved in cell wall biosynthesis
MKKIKVAMSQRICPEYRIPVFKEINKCKGIDFRLFFGKGTTSGSNRNAKKISGFKFSKIFTISALFNYHGEKYRVFHPTLPFYILKGKYDVLITEPGTNIFNNLFLFPVCKLTGVKFIWYTAGNPKNTSGLKKIISPLLNFMILHSDACITYNSVADNDLLNIGVEPQKIFRAQNTIDVSSVKKACEKYKTKIIEFKKQCKLDGYKTALYIGGVEERKRIKNLIEAALLLNRKDIKVKVVIVGDGPYLENLKDQLTNDEKTYVFFAGRQVENAPLYIMASDVVVLPGEGGLAINHAFACGKACIATEEAEGPAVRDYIVDGYNGYVAQENDVKSLKLKMEKIFLNDKLQQDLEKGAKETGEKFTVKSMVDSIINAVNFVAK